MSIIFNKLLKTFFISLLYLEKKCKIENGINFFTEVNDNEQENCG